MSKNTTKKYFAKIESHMENYVSYEFRNHVWNETKTKFIAKYGSSLWIKYWRQFKTEQQKIHGLWTDSLA